MQNIQLDISRKAEIPAVETKQGDVGRKFQAVITDQGAPYPIPYDAVLSLWYSGTSGEGNYSSIAGNSPFVISENTVTVELIAQMLSCSGGGNLCLVICQGDGKQIGLWNIPYFVEKIPGIDSPEAEEHFSALSEMVTNLVPDVTLSQAGRAADAKAVSDALAQIPGFVQDGGTVTTMEQLSAVCYAALTKMKVLSSKQIAVTCDMDEICGNACLELHKSEGMDSAYEATAVFTSCEGDLLYATTLDESREGEWSPLEWCWLNPPMKMDVEYRTVERHMGQSVYTKLVNIGALPNSGTKYVPHGISLTQPLRCCAYITGGDTIPAEQKSNNYAVSAYFNAVNIIVESSSDMSEDTARVQIWYTKS